jgi:pimeloyl-ACP methyl ester carboxylesterase
MGAGGVATGAPVVIPDLTCGGVLDSAFLPPTLDLGGRDVYVDYPCDKPAGTPTTVILNLHGTMGAEAGKIYQRSYFPAFKFLDTHNFVVLTPKSVVSQWGNGDGGVDEPHLLAVLDWAYETFSAFDLRELWVAGHSWGSAYTLGFACKPQLEGRVAGVILMSGGAGLPSCADRLSILATVGELDIVPGQPDHTVPATAHGCDASTSFDLGANRITDWPNCDAGWVHRNYFMVGKAHGFSPVDWPDEQMVTDMADAILSSR